MVDNDKRINFVYQQPTGVRCWTSVDSTDFDAKQWEKQTGFTVVAQGVQEEEAIDLCRRVSQSTQIAHALQTSRRPNGVVDERLFQFKLESLKILSEIGD